MYIDDRGRTVLQGAKEIHDFKVKMVRLRENRKLHGRTTFQNLPISIENRRGSVRKGTDDDGEEWRTKMKVPYGYIPGTEGVDGDALDVFVGPDEDAAFAYIVHCNTPDGAEFDEDKVMLGFASSKSAKQCFLQHYDDPKFYGGMDAIPMWKFRERAFVKKHTTKKLVASRREAASLQLPGDVFERPQYESYLAAANGQMAGRGTDQDMMKSILGHHQDIMEDPEVREAQEHGVKGMKWGIRKNRQKHAGVYGKKKDLANDPRTLSMMQVVHRTKAQLDAISAQQKQRGSSGNPKEDAQRNHEEVLDKLKELGWEILKSAFEMTGIGESVPIVSTLLRHAGGQVAKLKSDSKGNHKLSTKKSGSKKFESRMGSFVREGKRLCLQPQL